MRSTRQYFLTLLLIPVFVSARGQGVNVTSAFDSARIYLGDQIRFTVTVDKPAGLKLIMPLFSDTLVRNIEILSGPVIDSASQNGRVKIIEKYLITSFDSGRYQVPPVFAELQNQNGIKRFYSNYAILDVMRVKIAPPDTAGKIFDIIKPYRAPVTLGDIMPWVLLAIVAGALIWLSVRYIKKLRSPGGEPEIIRNPDPAHVIALRELEKLRNEKLWQNGETKKYYTRLTEVLRQYLENRFMVYSMELTTNDTLVELVKTGFKKNGSYNKLKNILTSADLVKFAKYKPEPSENDSVFEDSWNFVLDTKAEPEAETIAAADEKGGEGKS